MDFQNLFTYRETELETIPLDEEIVVKCLQGLGVKPVFAETNGRKLRIHFIKDEVDAPFQQIQRSFAGLETDLKLDMNQVILSEAGWKSAIAMMHAKYKN